MTKLSTLNNRLFVFIVFLLVLFIGTNDAKAKIIEIIQQLVHYSSLYELTKFSFLLITEPRISRSVLKMFTFLEPIRLHPLLLFPLRTGLESFPSSGSSPSKATFVCIVTRSYVTFKDYWDSRSLEGRIISFFFFLL